jgi:hypothetical protein
VAIAAIAARGDEAPRMSRPAIDAAFDQQLSRIAAKCDDLGLTEEARVTRQWRIPRDPSRLYVFLPTTQEVPTVPTTASAHQRFWHDAWLKSRRDYAEKLIQLARETATRGDVRDALLYIHEAAYQDPANSVARRLVGSSQSWKATAKPSRTPHPKFQWPATQYWRVETPHYEVKTNHSAEEGVRLAQRLEDLYGLWRQVFAEYWLSKSELLRALDGGPLSRGAARKFQVVLFRDREEYVAQLRRSQSQIDMTEGYYETGTRIAYFFANGSSDESAWLHEGTHQLFYETGDVVPHVGLEHNFWAIEAVALFMESASIDGSVATVGGFDAERLQYARFRALSEDFYLPLAELVALGRDDLQRHADIRRIYSQAAGLGHFFLQGDVARRQAFVRYLIAIHQGRDRTTTLAETTGTPLDGLDPLYRTFLNVEDEDLAHAYPPARIAMLSLGGTSVTDAGLTHLQRYPNLTWLNLAATRVTDDAMPQVAQLRQLRQLYLTGTQVTDVGAKALEQLVQLEILDTSGSAISDSGWKRLQQKFPMLRMPE